MTGLTQEEAREALAAEYVLGTLDARSCASVADAMQTDAGLRQAVQSWEKRLIGLTDLVDAEPALDGDWAALEAAIDQSPQAVRNLGVNDGAWELIEPGVERKTLWSQDSFLVRVEPGATISGHEHPAMEHCVVISGRMVVGNTSFGPGDYHGVQVGFPHVDITAPDGLLLLVRHGG